MAEMMNIQIVGLVENMRFEELSKKHQEFLMYCLSDYIKGKVKREGVDGFIEPTYDEYKIVDGYPESKACKGFSVKFKVV